MNIRLLPSLAGLASAWVPISALAQSYQDRSDSWGRGWEWSWGHVVFGSIMMILLWAGLIVLIVFAVRWLGDSSGGVRKASSKKSALDILEERFAHGKMEKEDFEERKQLLSS